MSERRLYSIDNGRVKSFELVPDLDSLESLKKEYVSSPKNEPLFYEITCREYPTWDTKGLVLPISKINSAGGIFTEQKESILKPLSSVPQYKKHLLDVYCKHDLISPQLKLITNDYKTRILYYFLFLSDKYQGKYKIYHFDNILSLSKDLFAYELLLQGDFESVTSSLFDDVDLKAFFDVEQTGEFSDEELHSFLSQKAYGDISREEQITHKLVKRIRGN